MTSLGLERPLLLLVLLLQLRRRKPRKDCYDYYDDHHDHHHLNGASKDFLCGPKLPAKCDANKKKNGHDENSLNKNPAKNRALLKTRLTPRDASR